MVQVRSIMSSPMAADARHVAHHDLVAALGHDRQLLAGLVGPHAEAEEADPAGARRLALTWARWRPVSAQVSWRFSSGAPDSSSWPAGSRLTVAVARRACAMTLPPSSTGSQPNSLQAEQDVADAAGLVVGGGAVVGAVDRRASRARCRCASRPWASRQAAKRCDQLVAALDDGIFGCSDACRGCSCGAR